MDEKLCSLDGRCAEVERLGLQVERINQKVFGNGQPGLLSDVRAIQGSQNLIHTELQATKTVVDRIKLVLYVGMGALGGLQAIFKFVPW